MKELIYNPLPSVLDILKAARIEFMLIGESLNVLVDDYVKAKKIIYDESC